MPHVIRLRGPWNYLVDDSIDCAKGVFRVPGTIRVLRDRPIPFQVILSRTFHQPTGLEKDNLVALSGCGVFGNGYVIGLNGAELGTGHEHRFRYRVTDLLQPTNQISIKVFREDAPGPGEDPVRIDDVSLEIE
jgi:hypothetical protein